jgi:uncharacterized protein
MATRSLTIRGIPDQVLARLRARAARHHRSLNGEVLAILSGAGEHEDRGAGVVRETAPAYVPGDVASAITESSPRTLLAETIDRAALARVCRQHHIQWLALFGSHARGDARPDSDVDVVVVFEPGRTPGLGIIRVAEALRPVLGGGRVDLVTRRGLSPRMRDRVLAEAQELYAA